MPQQFGFPPLGHFDLHVVAQDHFSAAGELVGFYFVQVYDMRFVNAHELAGVELADHFADVGGTDELPGGAAHVEDAVDAHGLDVQDIVDG